MANKKPNFFKKRQERKKIKQEEEIYDFLSSKRVFPVISREEFLNPTNKYSANEKESILEIYKQVAKVMNDNNLSDLVKSIDIGIKHNPDEYKYWFQFIKIQLQKYQSSKPDNMDFLEWLKNRLTLEKIHKKDPTNPNLDISPFDLTTNETDNILNNIAQEIERPTPTEEQYMEAVREEADLTYNRFKRMDFEKSTIGKIYKSFKSDISYKEFFSDQKEIDSIFNACQDRINNIELKDLLAPFLVEMEALGILDEYEKNKLNNIYKKYGSKNQSELIKLLLIIITEIIVTSNEIVEDWENYFPTVFDMAQKYLDNIKTKNSGQL